ncbi:MAG: DUF5018 domain-containing protein [Cytophagaceae bacterium]
MRHIYLLMTFVLLSSASMAQTIFEDAESNTGFYSYTTPGSGMASITNPQSSGINTSSMVKQYTRPGAADGGFSSLQMGFNSTFTSTIDLTTYNQVKIKIFAPKMVKVLGIIGINGNAGANVVRSTEVTLPNQWQELSFDFSAIASGTTYNRLIFQIDPGTNNTGTYLLDDIRIDNVIAAPHITTSGNGGVYNLNLSAVDIADNNNASDLKVSFNKLATETYINAYRVIVVKDAVANNFTLAAANALPATGYTEIAAGAAFNYNFVLPSTQLDSDGDPINNSTSSYRIFVLSVAKSPATINNLSSPSNVILSCSGPVQSNIFDDAECQRNITYSYLSSSGYLPVIANPVSGGINTSAYVLSYKRPGNADGNYSSIQATFSADQTQKLDLTERNQVKIKIYSPAAGVAVLCQLNSNTIQKSATITAANTWQELTFDFSGQAANTGINKILILISPNTTNSGQYYLDDFKIVSAAKAITAFSFQGLVPAVTDTIDEVNKTISLTVPSGTDVTGLVANFTSSLGSTVSVSGTTQVSGTTPNDFTNPVSYTVTAEDGSFVSYMVSVTKALSNAKAIITYNFSSLSVTGTIDQTNKAIDLTVPSGTDVSALVADFTVSALATIKVGSIVQTSGSTANDFSSPVVYTVIAEDGSMVNYTVTVTIAAPSLSSAKIISAFGFSNPTVNGVIDEPNKTISITVPSGTDVSALVADFTVSPLATVKISSTGQTSGSTANDFSNPVIYTVIAEDGTMADYTVTVMLSTATGLQSTNLSSFFHVSPTVSQGLFNITVDRKMEGDVMVYDRLGRIIFRSGLSDQTINLSKEASGNYYLKVQTSEGSSVIPIIKQ